MSQAELDSQKLLIKAGLIYQIAQSKKTVETTQNELDRNVANIIIEQFSNLLNQVDDLQSVTKAKQWFRDISEGPIERGDINYQIYLEGKTGIKVDLFGSLIKKVTRYLKVGRINAEHQYREVELALQLYSHQRKLEEELIALDNLLFTFRANRKNNL